MKHSKSNRENPYQYLILEYETTSQKGKVCFLEETDFLCLIDHYQRSNQRERILTVINHAIEQHPSSVELYLTKARYYLQKGEGMLAVAVLKKAAIFTTKDLELNLLTAEAFGMVRRFPAAHQILEEVKENTGDEDLARILWCESILFRHEHRYAEEYNALKAALQCNAASRIMLERMWLSTELTGRYPDSALLYEAILDKDAFNDQAWYNLGKVFEATDKFKEAIDAFEFAFFLNEKMELAYRDCAELLIELNDYERALVTLQEAVRLFEADWHYFFRIAHCYEKLEEPTIAKAFYLKALECNDQQDEIYYSLGLCYSREEDWKTAVIFLKNAIKYNDGYEEYHAALAHACYRSGNLKEARAGFERAVELESISPDYWMKLIEFLLDTGQVEAAFDNLEAALLNSGDEALLYCQVVCLYRSDKRQDALFQLTKALEINYELHSCLFEMYPEIGNDTDVNSLISAYQ